MYKLKKYKFDISKTYQFVNIPIPATILSVDEKHIYALVEDKPKIPKKKIKIFIANTNDLVEFEYDYEYLNYVKILDKILHVFFYIMEDNVLNPEFNNVMINFN